MELWIRALTEGERFQSPAAPVPPPVERKAAMTPQELRAAIESGKLKKGDLSGVPMTSHELYHANNAGLIDTNHVYVPREPLGFTIQAAAPYHPPPTGSSAATPVASAPPPSSSSSGVGEGGRGATPAAYKHSDGKTRTMYELTGGHPAPPEWAQNAPPIDFNKPGLKKGDLSGVPMTSSEMSQAHALGLIDLATHVYVPRGPYHGNKVIVVGDDSSDSDDDGATYVPYNG